MSITVQEAPTKQTNKTKKKLKLEQPQLGITMSYALKAGELGDLYLKG